MKLIVLSGSRNPDGQTATAISALAEGARTRGAEVDVVFLPTLNLERCRQCNDDGWGECRSFGDCVIEDDFEGLVDRLRAADAVVFATPVYFSELSESLRCFLDRLRRVTRNEMGARGLSGKPAIGICVAGGGGGGAPNCANLLDRMLGQAGFDLLDMVLVRRQNQDLKLNVLRLTGEWLASRAAVAVEAN